MNIESLLTKKTNLVENDSLTVFDGWAAQQNPKAFEVFYDFIKEVRPSRILEIGTSLGGFTRFLNEVCKNLNIDCNILTYDIYGRQEYDILINEGVDLRIENVFNDSYTILKESVINFIQTPGVTIVLCDGGDKIMEFNLISDYLKSGDYILAHDYAENAEVFQKEVFMKSWNWHEISEHNITEACNKNNLVDYKREIFTEAVWVCKIKE
jgi:cephalosporin hydroxylase